MRVDLSSIYSTSAIKFNLKAIEIPKLKVVLFSYAGKNRRLNKILNENHFIDIGNGNYEAILPLKSLEMISPESFHSLIICHT